MVAALCGFPARPRLRPHAGPAPRRRYERRRPEKTPLHKIISENLASWLEWRDVAERPVPGYVEEELRGYLECGILCFGFGRALCTGCGQGFVIAFSCKGRGVCPSCNGRHMAQTAAHLVDHVIPPVPVRQWVISVPKRLRGFLADRPAAVAALTRIFIEEIERLLGAAAGVTSDASGPAAARPRLGAVSFLHRFGSALNHHMHLHVCATEGVFVPAADGAGCDASPAFLPARPINQADLAALTERVHRRVIHWFRLTRLLDTAAAADMLTWENSGFSVDASVRITLIDRDVPSYFRSLEHLLRYCARPPFALERLSVSRGADGQIARIRYVLPRHKAANWVGPSRSRKSTRPGANGVVELSPFEFLDRLADLVPPPRKHRHRYHGVFAPNHKLRRAVTALALGNVGKRGDAAAGGYAVGGHTAGEHATGGCCDANHANQKPRSHDTSRIAWAKLMARVGEEFPLACPTCGGDIRLITFRLFYQCDTIPGLRTVGNLRLLRTSCPRSGADPEDPDTSRRTARAASIRAGSGPADRLGRDRASAQRPGNLSTLA